MDATSSPPSLGQNKSGIVQVQTISETNEDEEKRRKQLNDQIRQRSVTIGNDTVTYNTDREQLLTAL
ncbi:unnamed protein product [Adineta ricciae]|uniref:Uncharacterized protein n=1 Tax=Adineta ricciae TaxID=249248 RepID=A0A816G8C2_ADIRI|nr:unnamed protein product [Adineta ricciae]